jgi:hypothetical protein
MYCFWLFEIETRVFETQTMYFSGVLRFRFRCLRLKPGIFFHCLRFKQGCMRMLETQPMYFLGGYLR